MIPKQIEKFTHHYNAGISSGHRLVSWSIHQRRNSVFRNSEAATFESHSLLPYLVVAAETHLGHTRTGRKLLSANIFARKVNLEGPVESSIMMKMTED